uniref:Uncharacterized protein n=1 Tax=Solanum lycopersicum TaxID=4081 RepID=A0A3Q7G012_SOLLC
MLENELLVNSYRSRLQKSIEAFLPRYPETYSATLIKRTRCFAERNYLQLVYEYSSIQACNVSRINIEYFEPYLRTKQIQQYWLGYRSGCLVHSNKTAQLIKRKINLVFCGIIQGTQNSILLTNRQLRLDGVIL